MQQKKSPQQEAKELLQKLFPDKEVKVSGDKAKVKLGSVTSKELSTLFDEGKELFFVIKRSDVGLALILNLKSLEDVTQEV